MLLFLLFHGSLFSVSLPRKVVGGPQVCHYLQLANAKLEYST